MAAASAKDISFGILKTYLAGTATTSAHARYSGKATTRSPTWKIFNHFIYSLRKFKNDRNNFLHAFNARVTKNKEKKKMPGASLREREKISFYFLFGFLSSCFHFTFGNLKKLKLTFHD